MALAAVIQGLQFWLAPRYFCPGTETGTQETLDDWWEENASFFNIFQASCKWLSVKLFKRIFTHKSTC
jgi:hypothetical protein